MIRTSWIALLAAAATTGGCVVGGGSVVTRAYNLTGFDSINASGGVNVVLKQGPFSISAEGPQERIDHLIIETSGSMLTIRHETGINFGWFGWSQDEIVTVNAPAYSSIKASGGVDIDGNNLQFNDLAVNISGGVDLNLSGACKSLTVDASGGADFGTPDLKCENATVTASGGADVDVSVTGAAKGHASGGGDVRFHGSPATFEKEESGGGDVSVDGRPPA
jgi:Putative auto-transporter adhesin, head GIN domain